MKELFSGNLAAREQSRALFQYILACEPVTRPMILDHLKLPPTTLNRALDRLLAEGLIVESGQAESTGGRPASLFNVIPDARLMMGLALGNESAQLIMLDLHRQTVSRQEIKLSETAGLTRAEMLANAAVDQVNALPDAGKRLLGVGMTTSTILSAIEMPALQTMLSNRLACPVLTADGLAGAALLLQDGQSDTRRVALLTIGDRLTLEQSDSCRDDSSDSRVAAAVAGFLVPDPLEEEPTDLVPVENLVTIPSIGKRFAAMRDNPELGFADFQTALQQSKKKALRLLDATAESLALLMVNTACLSGDLDFVLSGELPELLPSIIDQTADKVAWMSALAHVSLRLVRQDHGAFLPAAGAAVQVLSRALNRSVHIR